MSDLARWLDSRRPAPPPSLRRALAAALERGDPGTGPLEVRLADAGLAALERVVAVPSTRDRAIELLAADALLTYACEAAVEEEARGDDGALARLCARLEPARFAAILESTADTGGSGGP